MKMLLKMIRFMFRIIIIALLLTVMYFAGFLVGKNQIKQEQTNEQKAVCYYELSSIYNTKKTTNPISNLNLSNSFIFSSGSANSSNINLSLLNSTNLILDYSNSNNLGSHLTSSNYTSLDSIKSSSLCSHISFINNDLSKEFAIKKLISNPNIKKNQVLDVSDNEKQGEGPKQQIDDEVDRQLNEILTEELENLIEECDDDSFFTGSFTDKVKAIINGEFSLNSNTFLEAFLKLIFSEFLTLLPTLVSILAICVLSSVVVNFRSQTLKNSTNDMVFYSCYGIIIILLLVGVWKLYGLTTKTVSSMQTLIESLMPALLTFMVALGGGVTAKVYQPAIALLGNGVAIVINNAVLPLFLVSIVFTILSNLSKNVRLDKLASFFRSTTTWIIGITFTIFTSFLAVQGLTASSIDGVSIRAAKFATKNYVPILGGYLSDGFDLILSSTMLIKNAFGVAGLVLLVVIVLAPIVKILAYTLGLRLISAITEPIADQRVTSILFDISKNTNILFVSIIAVAFMFFITIMLIIMSTNVFS